MRIVDYGAIGLENPGPPNGNTTANPFPDTNDQPASPSASGLQLRPRPAQCGGGRPYCSRASHCSPNSGCRCVADGTVEDWRTSCQAISVDASGVGRVLLGNSDPRDGNRSSNSISAQSSSPSSPADSSEATTAWSEGPGPGLLSEHVCPCNCTYVSKGCCTSDSGIVYEERRKYLGALRPPMESLECDSETGDWRKKGNS
ncbi:MAG: hypothetical protein Q9196_003995 [Gyalolechia fulgens]